METIAIEGGKPVRETMLPYGRQSIGDDDVQAGTNICKYRGTPLI